MKKTLGGDRLGSGKKMQVDLHGYERSTHDLGYLFRTTMSPGTLVPFMSEVALPGDTFDIDLDVACNTHPTIGPLFGSFKMQLDVFQAPIRLYNALLHNNALGIGMKMSSVKFPIIQMHAQYVEGAEDINNAQINPSSLLAYLGLRGVGIPDFLEGNARTFNAIPILAYWDIYKNYYSNKQEEIGAVIHCNNVAIVKNVTSIEAENPAGLVNTIPEISAAEGDLTVRGGGAMNIYIGSGNLPKGDDIIFITNTGKITLGELAYAVNQVAGIGYYRMKDNFGVMDIKGWRYRDKTDPVNVEPRVETFQLSEIDDMRNAILAYQSTVAPFNITTGGLKPYKFLNEVVNDMPNILSSQEGLGLKTYQSDLFNNWLQTEWIDGPDGISAITAIDTTSGSISVDQILLSKKVFDMLNRVAVSGGTYDDWLDVQYGHERYVRASTPMYMGGLIKEVVFQEVISNASTEGQELGTLGGRGVLGKKHKGGHIVVKVDEPSYIIGIISLTPRIDYSQGNKWDMHLKTMDDLHKPALDEIGFQELITEQLAWWDTKHDGIKWVQKSAGKQPAWLNYMTNVNRTYGNFAIQDNEMFMTLNRRYERSLMGDILDLTTYIDPAKFNNIFADESIDAQNFWVQIAVDITARRKMSARVMPNL